MSTSKNRPRIAPAPSARADGSLAGAAQDIAAGADLLLTARAMVDGLHQGRHPTGRRGASTEFYDYRAYSPGDPLKLVDWTVFARTDRHYVRRFRHESQLTTAIVVDSSASMGFAGFDGAGRGRTKLRSAKEIAAAAALLTVRQGDRAALVAPGLGGSGVVAAGVGWPHVHTIVRSLEALRAGGRAGLAQAMTAAAGALRGRGLVIAIGDALDDAEELLAAAAKLRSGAGAGRTARSGGSGGGGGGHDVVVLQTLTDDELDIARLGGARLVDPETRASVGAQGALLAEEYGARINAHVERLRTGLASMGARHALWRTSQPPVEALAAIAG